MLQGSYLKDGKPVNESSAERWRIVDELHARNRDVDPDEVERDVAEALAEARHPCANGRANSLHPGATR